MTNDKGILIKNIYYMLAYAFQVLNQKNYRDMIEQETFDDAEDLFAAILSKGVSQQLKQGLYREYVSRQDDLTVLRGKLDVQGTIKIRMRQRQCLACQFDELSENNMLNQIIKATAMVLIRSKENKVKPERKKELCGLMLYFGAVDDITPGEIKWSTLRFRKNNRTYEMLVNICYFVLHGLLQTTEDGQSKMVSFVDEHMETLYEKFILEYYKKHHPELSPRAAAVNWNVGQESDETAIQFLPQMKTDVTLQSEDRERTLIIDAKYYSKTMQKRFDKSTYHSGNLYQIFSYVKNWDKQHTGKVSGMLLYAKTEEAIIPNGKPFSIDGNTFSVRTLDLNQEFEGIKGELEEVVEAMR